VYVNQLFPDEEMMIFNTVDRVEIQHITYSVFWIYNGTIQWFGRFTYAEMHVADLFYLRVVGMAQEEPHFVFTTEQTIVATSHEPDS
jgi:hypothetical protein